MSFVGNDLPPGNVADFLRHMRHRGIRVWLDDGQVRYQAPRGTLTPAEVDRLRGYKGAILRSLQETESATPAKPAIAPGARKNPAPLTFTQLAHWNSYRLGERTGLRHIASATRLRGLLNIDALGRSLAEVVRAHDALRTHLLLEGGVPMQRVAESVTCNMPVDDLTKWPSDCREAKLQEVIEEHILEPVDVATDPLFGVRLLRVEPDVHVLVIALEHVISDAVSLTIFLRDLLTAYGQCLLKQAFSLPRIPLQFADFATWQRSTAESLVRRHGQYWRERLCRCGRLRFPADMQADAEESSGWGVAPLRIGPELRAELQDWCARRRTTVVIGAFAAYVALVLRWCGEREGVFRYLIDGRTNSDIENTIGFFASALYLRLACSERDGFGDLIASITEEYCLAYEHADSGYLGAQLPRPEVSRTPAFNWIPQPGADVAARESAGEIACSIVHFPHPLARNLELDSEPFTLLYDVEGREVAGEVWFPRHRFSAHSMQRFASSFVFFIRMMLTDPHTRVWRVPME